jgi:hypothetical protein
MSDFFKKIANGAIDQEESMLGPDYKYYDHIVSPGGLGVTSDGTMGAMGKNVAAIVNYVELLVEGGGPATKGGLPLGPKFYVKTAGKCKDITTKKVVPRYIYIDNVPDGNIPLISSGLGENFSEFKGLLPGILEDSGSLNPLSLFSAFQQGATPDCKEVSFPVQGDDRDTSGGTITSGHVAVSEINEYLAGQKLALGKKPAAYKKLLSEGFLSGNRLLRGENTRKSKPSIPPLAHVYLTGAGCLLLYLMYKMLHKK